MKKTVFFIILLAFVVPTACHNVCLNSDESHIAAFQKLYPQARFVEWEHDNGMLKAEFRQGGYEKEAWFQHDGTWVRTVTEVPVRKTPSAVIAAVKNHLGNAWKIDEVDLVEQTGTPAAFYRVECEKIFSDQDIQLRVTPEGVILNL